MIYVIGNNRVLKKNIYKVGFSTQTLDELRTRYATYYGAPDIKYYWRCGSNYRRMETEIFDELKQYRIYSNRELFECHKFIIKYAWLKVSGKYRSKNYISRLFLNIKKNIIQII